MWAYTVFILMTMATMAYLPSYEGIAAQRDAGRANAVAHNFLAYERAVTRYADDNPTWTGAVANAQSVNLVDCDNSVTAASVLVWAELDGPTQSEVYRVAKSAAFGSKSGGLFLSQSGVSGDALPAAIPNGATVYYRSR